MDYKFISVEETQDVLERAWASSAPFSLVRLGDGENTILRYPNFTDDERVQFVLQRALELRVFSRDEIEKIRVDLVEATKNADLLGIYDSGEPHKECVVYKEHLEYIGIQGFLGCTPSIHIIMQCFGWLENFIRKAPYITLICGRDVLAKVKAAFPHSECEQILVPTERQYRLSEDMRRTGEHHFPNVYSRVKQEIDVRGPDHLFLIGAGILGKAYCHTVKQRGGFAIDIGSVFDYWAQVPTRESKKVVVEGKCVFEGESRWPGIELGSAPQPEAFRSKFPSIFRKMSIRSMT